MKTVNVEDEQEMENGQWEMKKEYADKSKRDQTGVEVKI